MKPPVEDKLVISLLGFEREEDTTALILSVLRNVDGEGHEIYDCERTLTGINACPHWIHDVSTITPNRNIKNSQLENNKFVFFPSFPKLGYSTNKSF